MTGPGGRDPQGGEAGSRRLRPQPSGWLERRREVVPADRIEESGDRIP
jgi:hypothetical protein